MALRIVWIIGPLALGIYLSLISLPTQAKIIVWIICLLISMAGVRVVVKESGEKKRQDEGASHDRWLLERQELRGLGLPTMYINGLGENPLLRHFFNKGQRYEKEYRFEEATEEYRKCLSHPEATAENRVAANILIGNCYYAQSRFREAEKHYREALDISKGVKDKTEKLKGKASALGNIGIVLADKGDLVGALENHRKALEINEKIGNPLGMARDYGNIGIVLYQKGDLQGALENHRKALEINEKIGPPEGMAGNYGNIGIVLAKKGDLEAALENFAKVLEIEEKLGRPHSIANAYGNIGNVLSQKGDLDGALENYNKSLEITEKIGLHSISANQYINKAIIYSQKNDYKSAALLELKALFIYSQIGMKPDVEKAQRRLAISVQELKEQGKFEEFLREAKEKFGKDVEKLLGGLFTTDEADETDSPSA